LPLEEFDLFVERLKDMIPFSALAPVDEEAILVSKNEILIKSYIKLFPRNLNLCRRDRRL
jgi:hypothetical protein